MKGEIIINNGTVNTENTTIQTNLPIAIIIDESNASYNDSGDSIMDKNLNSDTVNYLIVAGLVEQLHHDGIITDDEYYKITKYIELKNKETVAEEHRM